MVKSKLVVCSIKKLQISKLSLSLCIRTTLIISPVDTLRGFLIILSFIFSNFTQLGYVTSIWLTKKFNYRFMWWLYKRFDTFYNETIVKPLICF